ncbi:MAG TPA: replication protein RepA, partial [Acidimicrobiales bacterium]|nr:replication protein RepA [Acidimicrobiales bacterium]
LKDQTRRLFSTAITTTRKKIVEVGVAVSCDESFLLAEKSEFWWSPHKAEDSGRWQPTVTLSKPFYDEIIQHPVPVDLRALRALKRSPFCLDIYAWATHRKSYLKRPTEIPWEVLAQQFGGDYARLRDFKASFMAALIKVSVVYDQLDFEATERSLLLKPAAPHVARKGRLRKST